MAEATTNIEKDDELEELLESALEDFNKSPPAQSDPKDDKTENLADGSTAVPWNNEFLLEAQKTFEQNVKALFDPGDDGEVSPDHFGEQLQKITEEANKVLSEHSRDPEFSATIAQTLKNLSDNSAKMQADLGPDALSSMLGGLGLGTEEDSDGDFMPFMQSMMQSLISKDVLYPSIKELTDKYPSWLEHHKESLSETEYDNFNKQFEVMRKVCIEFEKETECDDEETKKDRFMVIFSLMEEMQKLGQPPKDLCDESPFMTFCDQGSPTGLPDPSQCSIM